MGRATWSWVHLLKSSPAGLSRTISVAPPPVCPPGGQLGFFHDLNSVGSATDGLSHLLGDPHLWGANDNDNGIPAIRIQGDAALALGDPHILPNGQIPLRPSLLLGRNQDAELSTSNS